MTGVPLDRDYLVQILHSLASRPVVPELSEHDARILDDAGFTGDRTAATTARLDRDIRMATLVHNSKTIDDAAAHLGVTPARIRQRITTGAPWAFDSGRNRLLLPAVHRHRRSPPTSTRSCRRSQRTCTH